MENLIGVLFVMSLVSLIVFGIRKTLMWKNGETEVDIRELRKKDTEGWGNIEKIEDKNK